MNRCIINAPIKNKIGYIDYPAGRGAGMRFNFSDDFENWINQNIQGNLEIINYDSFDSYLELEFDRNTDYTLFVLTYENILYNKEYSIQQIRGNYV